MAKYIKTEEGYKQIQQIDGYDKSDWSVNDETNPAFIKNRTHYDAGDICIPANAADGTEVYWEGPTGNEVQGQDYFITGSMEEGQIIFYAYKVSNEPIAFDMLDNIKLKEVLVKDNTVGIVMDGEEAFGDQAIATTQEFVVGQIKGYIVDDVPVIISVIQDTDLSSLGQTGVATIGTYFFYSPNLGDNAEGIIFLNHLKHNIVKQLDLKYIPDIAFGTLEMSKVGTTATIKYTDRNSNIQTVTINDGQKGADGQPGYVPVRGTDYWTEADKAEIKSYVDNAILGGSW